MTPADFAAVHERAFQPHARGWRADEFEQLLANPSTYWVGDTRAFALARIVGEEAELLTLACDPEHQRQGLARACLIELMKATRLRSARRVFLEVASDNLAALGLYATLGFKRVGLRERYYHRSEEVPVDAIVLRKSLCA
ncbi:MAG: GNAT family N-acetyltransferase [Pseudomonadota bacterium]